MKKQKVYIVILESIDFYERFWKIEAVFDTREAAVDYINNGYVDIIYKKDEDYWLWNTGTPSCIYISEYVVNETQFDRNFRLNEEMKRE